MSKLPSPQSWIEAVTTLHGRDSLSIIIFDGNAGHLVSPIAVGVPVRAKLPHAVWTSAVILLSSFSPPGLECGHNAEVGAQDEQTNKTSTLQARASAHGWSHWSHRA